MPENSTLRYILKVLLHLLLEEKLFQDGTGAHIIR